MFRLTAITLFLLTAPLAGAGTADASPRPSGWAQPIDLPGLPNFYLVTSNLYRGAQPTAEGMAQLQALGIRSDVSLRLLRSDSRAVHGTTLQCRYFGTVPWRVHRADVVKFLKVAIDTNNLPLFVHCEHGADRTGLMCAMYRIVVCDWTKQQAIDEMEHGGFHFNPGWKKIIAFINQADVADLKRRVGLPAATWSKT